MQIEYADVDERRVALQQLKGVEDRVWEREWLKDFRPMRFGRRLWVCPAGQRPDGRAEAVLALDPGLAFGTGTHPTTALCLEWLDAGIGGGERVLDYGCGSGILALAALRLGAAEAAAYDIDRQALRAKAREIDATIHRLVALRRGLRHAAACPAPDHMACPTFRRLLKEAAAAGRAMAARQVCLPRRQTGFTSPRARVMGRSASRCPFAAR